DWSSDVCSSDLPGVPDHARELVPNQERLLDRGTDPAVGEQLDSSEFRAGELELPARRVVDVLTSLERSMRFLAPAAIALLALTPALATAQRVGTTAAVNPQASGQPPGGQARLLIVGQDVVFEEKIVTSEQGQT